MHKIKWRAQSAVTHTEQHKNLLSGVIEECGGGVCGAGSGGGRVYYSAVKGVAVVGSRGERISSPGHLPDLMLGLRFSA